MHERKTALQDLMGRLQHVRFNNMKNDFEVQMNKFTR